MAALNVLSTTLAVFLSSAALAVIQPSIEGAPRSPIPPYVPSYVQRGNRVQEHYRAYTKRLHTYHESLSAALKCRAPELLSLLESPNPLQHGYQILPKIVVDAPSLTRHSRAQPAQYSWPWTDDLIDRASSKIDRSVYELNRALKMEPRTPQTIFERLAREYRQMVDQQRNIDAHIQYNRLWQQAVAKNRLNYDRENVLYDLVLKRQEVYEIFSARRAAALKSTQGTTHRPIVASLSELSSGLRAREKLLAREIDAATDPLNIPGYVRVEQQTDRWIVHVRFYTDIEDSEFVKSAQRAIEDAWHLRSGEDEFRIALEFSYVSPEYLYVIGKPPQNGDRMDLQRHVDAFPADRAILTTGAATTHVHGRAIILGPHDMASRVLAHELGHILGFRDVYFRGYKDLDKDGFQVMEVIADPTDIMGDPATGAVQRRHYQKVIANLPDRQLSGR